MYCADRGERKIEACYVKASHDNFSLVTQALEDQALEDQAMLPFQRPDLLATRTFEVPVFTVPLLQVPPDALLGTQRPARSPDAAPNALARLFQNERLQNERLRPCASGAPADRFRSPAPSPRSSTPRSPSRRCGEARDAESPRRHADQMLCRLNASSCMLVLACSSKAAPPA